MDAHDLPAFLNVAGVAVETAADVPFAVGDVIEFEYAGDYDTRQMQVETVYDAKNGRVCVGGSRWFPANGVCEPAEKRQYHYDKMFDVRVLHP